jgi:hypothetical protein
VFVFVFVCVCVCILVFVFVSVQRATLQFTNRQRTIHSKADLAEQRVVIAAEVAEFCEQLDITYLEASGKTCVGVQVSCYAVHNVQDTQHSTQYLVCELHIVAYA